MTTELVLDVMHQAFLKIILIAGPILIVAMVVGHVEYFNWIYKRIIQHYGFLVNGGFGKWIQF